MTFSWISVVLLVLVAANNALAVNYCSDTATRCNGYTHVACKNDGSFAPECNADAHIVKMTPKLRKTILTKHNEIRNEFAAGIEGFQPAARLPVAVWDRNLAKMAEYNVKLCKLEHDACRNTPHYRFVGQNNAISDWEAPEHSVESVAEIHVNSWYNEKMNAKMKNMLKYPMALPNNSTFGHLTVLVNERAKYVGCAISRETTDNGLSRQITTCNYSYDNVVNRPTYTPGEPGSGCRSGTDRVYTNLCSSKEQYAFNAIKL